MHFRRFAFALLIVAVGSYSSAFAAITSITTNTTGINGLVGPAPTMTIPAGSVTAVTGNTNSPVITTSQYTIGPLAGGPTIGLNTQITFTQSGATAVFQLPVSGTPASILGGFLTGYVSGSIPIGLGSNLATLVSQSNTSILNFGPIGGLWSVVGGLSGVDVVSGNQLTVPANHTAGATLTLDFIRGPIPSEGIPEPASLLLWGSVATAGMFLRRRKRS